VRWQWKLLRANGQTVNSNNAALLRQICFPQVSLLLIAYPSGLGHLLVRELVKSSPES
jgi:hypothetical protein